MTEHGQDHGSLSPDQRRLLLEKLLREKAQAIRRGPMSSAQRQLWLLDRLEGASAAYNVTCYFTISGALDAVLLERALNDLARRHGALRTTFDDSGGEPSQFVAPSIALLPLRIDLVETPGPRDRLAQLIAHHSEEPFNLSEGPLIRVTLVRLSSEEHVLLVVMHHIISDGWSIGVLVRDLFRIYGTLRSGSVPALRPLAVQYLDYATRQSSWLQGDEFRRQLSYWTSRLADLPILEIPTDHPRPSVKGHKGRTHSFSLDAQLSRALKQLCGNEGSTMFILLMTAFSVLLHRYSGQDDIVFGVPITNRNDSDLEGLIGFFVNTLVMRNDLSGKPGFRELLRKTSVRAIEAYANQAAPFERLVEALKPERNPGRNPLFQVGFALQNEYPQTLSFGGLEVGRPIVLGFDESDLGVTSTSTRVDVELHLWEGAERIRGTWSYDVALFEANTIERMTRNFVRLLRGIVEDPDQAIHMLPLLDEEERRRLLIEWNLTAAPYAREGGVHELFEYWAENTPGAPALAFEGVDLSYAELNARANRLARYLVAQGVQVGQLVGVCLERGVDLISCILGVFKAGGVYVPLDPKYPESRLRSMLDDAALTLILTDGNAAPALSGYAGKVLRLDAEQSDIDREKATQIRSRASGRDLAYVIYTSGSTGRPKGTLLEHHGLCKVSAEQRRLFGVGPGGRVLQFSSPNFDASLFDIVMALTTGATLVLARAESLHPGTPLLKVLREERVSILTIPPSSLAVLVPEALPDLKVLNVAGEACPAELVAQWSTGRRFFNLYGPTECTIWSTANECNADGSAPHIGRPIANTRLYILDANGQPVPVGVPGELYIGGDGLARGYRNMPELTAEKFLPDPFCSGQGARMYRTGDKVRYRSDGAVEFLGRMDFQIKIRGFRVEPGEVETVLRRLAGVRNAVVLAREDQSLGMQLVAYVVVDPGTGQHVLDELRVALRSALPAYMIPSVLMPVESLPLTPNGKVDTAALPEPSIVRRAAQPADAPRDELESAVVSIWKSVLGLSEVGVEDNFFDLGGHSLTLVKVHEQLKELLADELPIVMLFQYPTIRALVTNLREKQTEQGQNVATQVRSSRYEPIAIIGMAARFPGAPDVNRFWQNLREGVESIRFFSSDELRAAGVDDESLARENYVPAKGYLEDADLFDAGFFGYSPREAKLIDPQHRLFLEVAWQALENAGCHPGSFSGAIGVYAGSSENTYWASISHNAEVRTAGGFETTLGGGKDFLATRIAYKMDLRGPAVTVQTACSTSLVAVHEACKSLLSGECDIALAGGVRVSVPLITGYIAEANSIFSPDGHCRAFDEAGQGTLGGDGAGVVVLKRLAQALADGDVVHAVIRGSAINNDGSEKVGYTAPSVEGQYQAISSALAAAGIDPGSIGYIEAHGTGTNLGDPIEITALKRVFARAAGPRRIGIGSVKTNFGHLDAAAGIAGLIKAALALKHAELPPSLNFRKANPKLDIDNGPFYINDRLQPWPPGMGARRAGVSSFGIGGTNAHVVLEQPPTTEPREEAPPFQLLVLSARSQSALQQSSLNLAAAMKGDEPPTLADAAYTLQTGRKRFRHARFIVCRDHESAVRSLELAPAGASATDQEPVERQTVFLFSGQGSQHIDMARDLYRADRRLMFREVVDECSDRLRAAVGLDLRELIYPEANPEVAAERLTQTRYAQPALFVIEYALARQWMAWGVRPAAMLGHSIGEYVAACLAGVMSLNDALTLVAERGRLMYGLPTGSMLSVPMAAGELEPFLAADLAIAALNGPAISVVSGRNEAVHALQAQLASQGIDAKLLHTSHAFHSPMMEPILDAFLECVKRVSLKAPQLRYLSNVTGDWITADQATNPSYYASHLRHAVRFSEALERLFKRTEWVLLEVGPGQTLCTLARRHPSKPKGQGVVPSLPRPSEHKGSLETFMLETLGQLWLAGVEPDWRSLHAPRKCQRVVLPPYPFERQRYWIKPERSLGQVNALSRKRANVADWFYVPSWKRSAPPANAAGLRGKRWLLLIDSLGYGECMARMLRERGAEVTCVATGGTYVSSDDKYVIDERRAEDYVRLVADLKGGMPDRVVHMWALEPFQGVFSALERCESAGYHSLVFLMQALADGDAPMNLTVITSQVHEITGNEALCPGKALVLGPCRVAALEYPQLVARNVDIEPDGPASTRLLEALLYEADAESTAEPVVAYRGPYRWIQSVAQVSLPAPNTPRLHERGTYLITGGLGGIGLEIAGWLARKTSANLVLVARSPLPPRDQWTEYVAAHAQGDVVREKIEKLLKLERAGAQVLVCNADVCDQQQMQAAIDTATQRFGPIHGVIHAAGAAGGAVLQRQRPETVAPILAPKVAGTALLASLLQENPPEFIVLCSSLNSIVALAGRGEYIAANAYLDAFAHARSRDGGTRVIAVNWDAWVDVGMGAAHRRASGLAPASAEEGMLNEEALDAFSRILACDHPQVIVSVREFDPRRLEQSLNQTGASQEGPSAAGSDEEQSGLHSRPALANEFVAPRNDLERTLCSIWGELLGIEQIGVHDNFFELGGDSVVSIQVIARARQKGIKLTPKQTFDHQTVSELAAIAGGSKQERERQNASNATSPPVASSAAVRVGDTDIQDVEDVYELSPMQSGMLFDGLAVNNPGIYRLFSAYKLHGDLNVPLFRRAWQLVGARHAALRTSIHFTGLETPMQVVHRQVELPFAVIDLRNRDEVEQAEFVKRYMADERARTFDLGMAPLIRLALFETGPSSFWFLWSGHHIVLEGWSISIVFDDVITAYRALLGGQAPALPPTRPYRDFIAWLREQDYIEAEKFWRRQLQGFTSPTPLPGGNGSPHLASVVENYRGEKIQLGRQATAALEGFAREHRLTLSTVLRAAWAYLLSRFGGEGDVVFGTLVSGRSLPLEGVESIVGLFINLLPVRVRIRADENLVDWLKSLHAQQGEMSQYEFCGLSQIKRWSEMTGSVPLFETLLIFENWAGDVKDWRGLLEVRDFWGGQVGQGYPITVVVDPGEELSVSLLYDERRIQPGIAVRLLQYLQLMLETIPSRHDLRVEDLPGIAADERKTLLGHWSGRGVTDGGNVPVHCLIQEQASRTPDAIAVAHPDRQITYRELDDDSNRLASHLASLGVGPESIVGVCLDRSPDMIVGLLGILKAGGAYLPLDPKYPTERLTFMLEDAKAGFIVTERRYETSMPADRRAMVLLDAGREAIARLPASPIASSDRCDRLAYVIYTSGSTGKPKGVMVEHRSLAMFTRAAIDAYQLQATDRVLQFATINFDTAVEEIFPCLARGATLVLRTDEMLYSAEQFVRRCDEWRVTVADLPTAFWHELVDALDRRPLPLPSTLRLVIIGGEAALPQRVAAWHARVGAHPRLINTYGPTEATVVATLHELLPGEETGSSGASVVPIGRPFGPARTYVLDRRRELVPIGAVGELYIGGGGVSRGYLNRADLTSERFVVDPFSAIEGARMYRTGDLVRHRPDGVLEYHGRTDHQIKLRGHRIELGEIEAVLGQDPAVRDAVVVFRDDLSGPPALVAYVIVREQRADADALRKRLHGSLPDYMVPAALVFLEALPKLPNGKLDRRGLPMPMESEERGSIAEPRTATEREIAGIWRAVLGREKIGIHDNFFDLGGHSLLLLRMHGMLAEKFAQSLSFVDLFEHTTVEELAQLLDGLQSSTDSHGGAEVRDAMQQAGRQRLHAKRARAEAAR